MTVNNLLIKKSEYRPKHLTLLLPPCPSSKILYSILTLFYSLFNNKELSFYDIILKFNVNSLLMWIACG